MQPITQPREEPEQPQQPAARGLRRGLLDGWRSLLNLGDAIDVMMAKCNNLTETNFELAMKMAREGRVEDAIFRFRITLWLAPDHLPSMYNLACLYKHKGDGSRALQLFKNVLARQPDHADALYMVASLNPELLKPEMRPQKVPLELVAEFFDAQAPFYDQMQAKRLYRLPGLLHQLLRPALGAELVQKDMLDVGCGTGLCGAQFREEFANIVGVDLSNAMLDQANLRIDQRGVKIYNRLVQQDARIFMHHPEAPKFDVVVAMSMLPYVGELKVFALGAFQVLREHGMLAISFDRYTQPEGFGVMPKTGYFGHSQNYVLQVMQEAGFETVRTGEVEIAAQQFQELCFFRKPATK